MVGSCRCRFGFLVLVGFLEGGRRRFGLGSGWGFRWEWEGGWFVRILVVAVLVVVGRERLR